jgi:hypothetical protein
MRPAPVRPNPPAPFPEQEGGVVGRTANCPGCGAVLVWKLNPEKPGWWIARCECKDLHNNVDNDW